MTENWVPVVVWKGDVKHDFSGIYEVSDLGDIRRVEHYVKHNYGGDALKSNRPKKPYLNKNGYKVISLWKENKGLVYQMQRVVWESFRGKVPAGMQVNHIDEDKTNNRLDNLNLMSPSENTNWATRNERAGAKISKARSKWVIKLSLNNEILHFYPSARQAEAETGVSNSTIAGCCKGRYKTAGGFIWKHAI